MHTIRSSVVPRFPVVGIRNLAYGAGRSLDAVQNGAIDLRSDTVTRPTPGMMEAIMSAPLGDDVYGEDPSVVSLEEKVAAMTGKEAALFCPTGTMTNQIGVKLHVSEMSSVILDSRSHVCNYEVGGLAYHSRAQPIPVSPQPVEGMKQMSWRMTPEDVKKHYMGVDVHYARTKLVCLENTFNGNVFKLEEINAIEEVARDLGCKMHLDGARQWNACIATGIPLSDYLAPFDTASLCLSKGLGAPVGSMLVGPAEDMKTARQLRKLLGGGMRQAGLIAAAAEYAIDHHFPNLGADHDNAKYLGRRLQDIGIVVENDIETNMVFASLSHRPNVNWEQLTPGLEREGVIVDSTGPVARLVTHYQISKDDIDTFVAILNNLLDSFPE